MPSAQLQISNASFIKSEIERFESVHPSIYSIYELIEEVKDQTTLQSQIRDHVMIVEGQLACISIADRSSSTFVSFRFICQ
jgi:hypothetical protein